MIPIVAFGLALLWAASTPAASRSRPAAYLPVLNYHDIAPRGGPSEYDETATEADRQLSYLERHGYTAVTLRQYRRWLDGADIGIAKPVLITVDDGRANERAWDTLFRKHHLRGVLFVVTGFADGTTPGDTLRADSMSWSTIQSLASTGRWEIAFHAGQYGHGSSYASNWPIKLNDSQTLSLPRTCPYFYTCLGTVTTTAATGGTTTTTTAPETFSQYRALVTGEVAQGVAELARKVPSAETLAWAAPFNDAGQWTNLYDDPSGRVQAWFPRYMASKFALIFTETSAVRYGEARGVVDSLSGYGRECRFEVHTDTTIEQLAAALTDPAFARPAPSSTATTPRPSATRGAGT